MSEQAATCLFFIIVIVIAIIDGFILSKQRVKHYGPWGAVYISGLLKHGFNHLLVFILVIVMVLLVVGIIKG